MRYRAAISLFSILIGLLLVNLLPTPGLIAAGTILDPNGYKGLPFKYTPTVQTPTGEKPQSKLWYNDGRWWGDLFNNTDGKYHIYWLNIGTQTWMDTGTILDTRPQTKADCLWDGAHLYVASGGGSDPAGSGMTAMLPANLYRYSYNPVTKLYSLDSGFPVTIRNDGAETIVIDKDSVGTLWITYTQANKVYVNHSLTSDTDWNLNVAPFQVAGTNTNVSPDDISTLVAVDGKIGVLWSNESAGQFSGSTDTAFYFAAHTDGAADTVWTGGVALRQPNIADDHINIKSLQADASGNIFAMVKTSLNTVGDPQLLLLVAKKQANGSYGWNAYIESVREEAQTRPILLIDTEHRQLYVFSAKESGGGVYYKTTSLDNIHFNTGTNTLSPFMSKTGFMINNVTSTKQTVNGASGIVVLASHDNQASIDLVESDYYFHNYIDLGGAAPPHTTTPTTTATPALSTPTATPTIGPGGVSKPRVYVSFVVRLYLKVLAKFTLFGGAFGPLQASPMRGKK
jgi:hypothetical protein